MKTIPPSMKEARETTNEIANDLIKQFPGEAVTKQQIRNAYNLSWVKSSIVFSLLTELGFDVTAREVIVPVASSVDSTS